MLNEHAAHGSAAAGQARGGGAITRDEVAHLARLSRLALREDELDHLATQLDDIISAVARVQEVAAEDIPPTSHALPLTNVFRADEVRPSLTPDQALSGAPAADEQRFKVPRILDEEA
ncbi:MULTISPECIES: Asp-tRNA(Asn)/Glu-tRNA(Gln) amidotransferase subunit GatC [Actinoallomurus]|uniref:Aspartyl/glutamyl-tRNA(Asn/Gln) amidotransferase subunit C n=1 Tax=Actinoallomurus spadix TaxID=79912 RepID=A0ABP3G029_9ACTN|nr:MULTISPECIES: Asp-tRNA(Asn)/Glu-tRNA(Gln) amidotransferase subunit GatC [Actinoallomurus]MCO5970908.1 Asp-tRNA(Asn)/Glu-tRNA(Gln) amidotransferase subunit GatC [Actinoallomurus soli]MCO5989267.1 Asp-tRNA(Asn)/Glu-tRNA(Gln) amidotransferase subunit GatC [Actinoallomurus spadix]MCO5991984.1 Asp-tRNA(Asn)/Glu-tRNA(Gln) amidotransferase subunit GatC [Actinoallomurus rhizosphaericola]